MAGNTEIFIRNLTYFHDPSRPPSLSDINISLPKGSRTLLIGANGGVHSAFPPHSDQCHCLSTLIYISWQVNTASNPSRQATSHIRGCTNPNKRVRCVSRFPVGCYLSRHGMGSYLSETFTVWKHHLTQKDLQGHEPGRPWRYSGRALSRLSR